uniref:DNA mismatch repair protein MSH5 n=1 Tax=Bionectria ochroleuca TaxID=29856 RepID=A0A8H7NCI4_BIOOC
MASRSTPMKSATGSSPLMPRQRKRQRTSYPPNPAAQIGEQGMNYESRNNSRPGSSSTSQVLNPSSPLSLFNSSTIARRQGNSPNSIHEDSPADKDSHELELEDGFSEEIIMAIDLKGTDTMGCAYFNTSTATLYLAEDILQATLDVVGQLVMHARPTAFLVSRRAREDLMDTLEKLNSQAEQSHLFNLRVVPSSDFSNTSAREGLASLDLDIADSVQTLVSSSDNTQLGASHHETLKESRGPNSNSMKESLSIYGLFHFLACTSQGRKSLRQIFLRPTLDMDTIVERQRTIQFLLRQENTDIVRKIPSVLRRVKNVRSIMAHLRKGIDLAAVRQSFDKCVWASLRTFTVQALRLREMIASLRGGDDIEIVRRILEGVEPSIVVRVGELVDKTIDFDQSTEQYRPSVKEGIDPELDQLKRLYGGMPSFLSKVVKQVSRNIPEWAHRYIQSCVFLPQLGFLTMVEFDPQTKSAKYEGEGATDDKWEQLFTANGAVCYKNRYMRELDEQFGDMYCQIGDREVEIVHNLVNLVLEHEDVLIRASDLCGDFDALAALAAGAEKYSWTKPRMTTANILEIRGGRHPLQELVVTTFVPNDCRLSYEEVDDPDATESTSALLVTGPNHSGKSVFLKQTAIIVYLAHIGSFIPAESATIGLTDKILTRISTRESATRNESAFAIDLKQVVQATRNATERSLVLVDEFGKGTNSDDGAGLLAAVLSHFLSLGPKSPRLLVATHFHELFECGHLKELRGLAYAHMDVRAHTAETGEDGEITYLFKLTSGYSNLSFGGKCAALNGVPDAIVSRADAISNLLAHNEDLASACAKLSREEQTRLEEAEVVARRFLGAGLDAGKGTTGFHATASLKATLNNILAPP